MEYTDEQIKKVKEEIAVLENEPRIDFNAHLLPEKTDTFCDTIAFTSPNGKMSKRTYETHTKSLGKKLFGDWTPDIRHKPETANRLRDLHYALQLMGLVNRGAGPRKYPKIINQIISNN